MSTRLYVGNLSFETNNVDLQNSFGKIGTIESTNIIEDRDTSRSRGFAFVEMSSGSEADDVIEQFNGAKFNGRKLTINEAGEHENRNGNGGERGGFGGGGDRNNYGRDRNSRW